MKIVVVLLGATRAKLSFPPSGRNDRFPGCFEIFLQRYVPLQSSKYNRVAVKGVRGSMQFPSVTPLTVGLGSTVRGDRLVRIAPIKLGLDSLPRTGVFLKAVVWHLAPEINFVHRRDEVPLIRRVRRIV